MSVSSDGPNKTSDSSDKLVEKPRNCSAIDTVNNKSAFETEFRGFKKTPAVVVDRLDIRPYLNNNLKPRHGKFNIVTDCMSKNDISAHLQRLSLKCSVKIFREDLGKLKETFSNFNMVNFKCNICDKEYTNEKRLLNHQENKHMIVYKPYNDKVPKRVSFSDHVIVHEVNEYHRCRKCTKIFANYHFLKAHMKENHKKRRCYVCNYCKKKFVDRMFFKIHIKLHCDSCSWLCTNKSEYVEHRRTVCKITKKYMCRTCNESYFHFMDLKDHSYEHLGTFFICDICKDQFESKCAVAHHISFLHSNVRPTSLYTTNNLGNERLYLCNFCELSSVERNLLEVHVQELPDLSNRAMTGYKDFYFCDQCLKKFDTESDMLQHKWTHFLTNSDNSQTRKKFQTTKTDMNVGKKFNINEKLPDGMQPKVFLKKIEIPQQLKEKLFQKTVGKSVDANVGCTNVIDLTDDNTVSHETGATMSLSTDTTLGQKGYIHLEHNGLKTLINQKFNRLTGPKSRKTLISKYQCQTCGRYFSNNYCLNRHIVTMHSDYQDLQCKVCEEVFVWPSLLRSHKCIRLNHPEMPFDDARPEIHFDNLHEIYQNGIDNLNIGNDDYNMNEVDFEIPAPIVQLSEYNTFSPNNVHIPNALSPTLPNVNSTYLQNQPIPNGKTINVNPLQNLGYRVVMEEVPIEF